MGLGALAGVLAIAVRSIGFIAKMSAEAIEDLDPKPVEAIRAVGGSEFQVFLYAIIPQVLPTVVGVIIFEWEINIRRSSVLGLVGAGGLGLVFFRQLNTFNHPGVTTVTRALLRKIANARDQLLTFLDAPDLVQPANNDCERALRPAVISRKVTNGFRANWSAQADTALRTVVDTERLAGTNPYRTIRHTILA